MHRRRRAGFTLLLTLMILVFLTILVSQVRFGTRMEFILTSNARKNAQVSCAARSAIPLVMEKLRRDREENQTDSDNDMWAREMTGVEIGEYRMDLKVMDEDGKFNLNTLVDDEGNLIDTRREALLRLINGLEMDWTEWEHLDTAETLADKLIDYIDSDEVGSYEEAKINANRRLLSLEELLNIEGITRELLYGEEDLFTEAEEKEEDDPYAHLYEIDEEEEEEYEDKDGDGEPDEPFEGLFRYFTCYSNGAVNINSAPQPVLLSLSEKITSDIAASIFSYRTTTMDDPKGSKDGEGLIKTVKQVFETVDDLKKVEDVDQDVMKEILKELAPAPGEDKDDGKGDGKDGGNQGGNQGGNPGGNDDGAQVDPTQRSVNKIKVKSNFFTALIEVGEHDNRESYVGLFERTADIVVLRYWERTRHIPQQKPDDTADTN